MQDLEFSEVVGLICKTDPRFNRNAYLFVRQALDHASKELKRRQPERVKASPHLTGPELLEGMRAFALEQFGPMAKTVLNSWGVRSCADIGDIVFNLIDQKVFSKTESDRREDFAGIYDFDEVFVKPFAPARRRRRTSTESLDRA
jgi:uncharacterized repeat protein (TIGR04138 family)